MWIARFVKWTTCCQFFEGWCHHVRGIWFEIDISFKCLTQFTSFNETLSFELRQAKASFGSFSSFMECLKQKEYYNWIYVDKFMFPQFYEFIWINGWSENKYWLYWHTLYFCTTYHWFPCDAHAWFQPRETHDLPNSPNSSDSQNLLVSPDAKYIIRFQVMPMHSFIPSKGRIWNSWFTWFTKFTQSIWFKKFPCFTWC